MRASAKEKAKHIRKRCTLTNAVGLAHHEQSNSGWVDHNPDLFGPFDKLFESLKIKDEVRMVVKARVSKLRTQAVLQKKRRRT